MNIETLANAIEPIFNGPFMTEDVVRAVLDAMRSPDDAMIEVGRQAFSDWDEAYGITLSQFLWQAMIDSILTSLHQQGTKA